MAYTDRELFARLIQCEAGGEGEDGMRAVASVIVNRARVPYGEFFRVSQGGDVRSIMEQQGQFVCMRDSVNGRYNPQNVWNMDPEDIRFAPGNLAKLIGLVDAKAINSSVAKEVFEVMFEEDVDPEKYVEEKGLKTVNDEGALRKTIEEIIAANPQSVEDYHNGKDRAIGFLVGQTMKAMKGKADPAMVNQILKELL